MLGVHHTPRGARDGRGGRSRPPSPAPRATAFSTWRQATSSPRRAASPSSPAPAGCSARGRCAPHRALRVRTYVRTYAGTRGATRPARRTQGAPAWASAWALGWEVPPSTRARRRASAHFIARAWWPGSPWPPPRAPREARSPGARARRTAENSRPTHPTHTHTHTKTPRRLALTVCQLSRCGAGACRLQRAPLLWMAFPECRRGQ